MSDSRIVTLLFTDLVGSTELTDRLGDERGEGIKRTHFRLLREAVQSHGGEEVKNLGDGLMVVFNSAVEAVACAVEMQRSVDRHNRRPGTAQPLGVRIGLHLGEPIRDQDDYFGGAVNVAKRLCDAAGSGQILVSDLVRGLARARSEIEFRRLDAIELKGISEPVEPFEVVWAPSGGAEIPLPGSLTAPVRTPYVGRQQAREELRDHWKRAAIGERRTVLIAGEPGIGKTRLSAELAREAHTNGAIVLFGRCDEEAVIPYQPFVEALRFYVTHAPAAELADQLGEMAPDLARLIPEIRDRVPGLPEPVQLDPEAERYRLFLAVGRLLTEAARSAPLLLILDDLHWADRPTLALLRQVIRAQEPAPILVCGTYRDVELGRRHPFAEVLADLRRERAFSRILLRGLSQDEVESMLETVAEQALDERGRRLARALHVETEGNPFFMEEIMLHLVDTGRIYQDEQGRWGSDADDVAELGIPEGVREAVGRRLARLSDAANDALAHASVLGARFEFAELARMVEMDEDPLSRALEEALVSQLVVETADARGATYAFAHAIVRQVLYEELSLPRRQRLHLKAAETLEAVHASDVPLGAVATHYRTAGAAADGQKQIDYSLLAGQQAVTVFAFEEALKHLEAARELMEEQGMEPDVRARLLRFLGDLRYVTGLEYDKGVVALEEALRLYDELGDGLRAAQIHTRLGRAFSTFPGYLNIDLALDHYRTAERVLSSAEETPATAYAYIGLAGAALWATNTEEGLDAAQRAMAIGERLGKEIVWANAAAMYGWHLCAAGRPVEGQRQLEAGYEIADRLEHAGTAFLAAWMRGFTSYFLADPLDGIAWHERELAKPRVAGAPNLKLRLQQQLAQAYTMAGDHESLRALADQYEEDGDKSGFSPESFFLNINGQWPEFVERMRGLLENARATASKFEEGAVRFNLAETLTRTGDLAGAERYAVNTEAFGHSFGRTWLYWALVEIYERMGRVDDARAALASLRQTIGDGEGWRGCNGILSQAEGIVLALEGRHDEAEPFFADAVETSRKLETAWFETSALLARARALKAAGRIAEATADVEAVIERYRQIGCSEHWTAYALSNIE